MPTSNGTGTARAGGKVEIPEPSKKAKVTFASQDKLPKLPIPDLGSTCDKYLNALKPLQSSREHQDTVNAVHEFVENEGTELNERLKKYATGRTSYIEQFCKLRWLQRPWRHH